MSNNIQEICEWFNLVESNEQVVILDFLTDKSQDLSLINEENRSNLLQLVTSVVNVIVEKNDDREIIIKFLLDCGLDRIIVNALYSFCRPLAMPNLDAKLVAGMNKENVRKIADFIINKVIIYKDYKLIPFNHFVELTGINDNEKANRILRFIKNLYTDVSGRKYSLSMLDNKLNLEYKLPSELTEVIVDLIKQNLVELQQAYMLDQMNKLLNKFPALSCAIDDK